MSSRRRICSHNQQWTWLFQKKQMNFNCSLEKTTETEKRNTAIMEKFFFSYENNFAPWKVNDELFHKPSNL